MIDFDVFRFSALGVGGTWPSLGPRPTRASSRMGLSAVPLVLSRPWCAAHVHQGDGPQAVYAVGGIAEEAAGTEAQ